MNRLRGQQQQQQQNEAQDETHLYIGDEDQGAGVGEMDVNLAPEEAEYFGAAFDDADQLGDGRLDLSKLEQLMATIGHSMDDRALEELQEMLQEVGVYERSEDGCISRDDFLRVVALMREREAESSNQNQDAPLTAQDGHEVDTKAGCCAKVLYYTILFWASWFGADKFDFDGDGDFDPSDVQSFLNQKGLKKKKEFFKTAFAEKKATMSSKMQKHTAKAQNKVMAMKQAAKQKALDAVRDKGMETDSAEAAIKTMKMLSLDNLAGDWIVGRPGSDFIVTIQADGTCLYDGVHMGSGNDLVEEKKGMKSTVKRLDGWEMDMFNSTPIILIWTFPDQEPLEWRRQADPTELTLESVRGHWCVFEDGQETADTVEVFENGYTEYDGEHVSGEDLSIDYPAEMNGYPTIKRGYAGWRVDGWRSNAQYLIWSNPEEETFVEWKRPDAESGSVGCFLKNAAGNLAEGADGAADFLEDLFVNDDLDEGDAYEDKLAEELEDYVTEDIFKPKFMVLQVVVCCALWIIFAIKNSADGSSTSILGQRAGLDSLFPEQTVLRLYGEECVDHRPEPWRLISYQFTHVGAGHVGMNSILTLVLGIPIEALTGFFRSFFMFNIGVLGGAACYVLLDSRNSVVGMSGGCYALIGIHFAELCMNWEKSKFRVGKIVLLLGLILVENLNHHVGGVKEDGAAANAAPGASNAAHIGGGVAGILIGIIAGYNHGESTRCDYIWRIVSILTCIGLVTLSVAWYITSSEPYPLTDLSMFGGTHYILYWHQQVSNKRCLGNGWRCVRCECLDLECRAGMESLPQFGIVNISKTGWWRAYVPDLLCPIPWFDYEEGRKNDRPFLKSYTSMNFDSIEYDAPGSVCYAGVGR